MGCVLLGMGIWVGVYLAVDVYLECIYCLRIPMKIISVPG